MALKTAMRMVVSCVVTVAWLLLANYSGSIGCAMITEASNMAVVTGCGIVLAMVISGFILVIFLVNQCRKCVLECQQFAREGNNEKLD